MFHKLFRLLSNLYGMLWMLIVSALLGAAAVLVWHFYQEERLQNQLVSDGDQVTVRVERTDRQPRGVLDALSSFVYVGFSYHNKPYETRCVNDTSWLSPGDRVALLYHPQLDVFRQPRARAATETRVVSRLVKWTVISELNSEKKALGLFIMIVVALFFTSSGLLVSLTGLTFIQTIARSVLILALGFLALFYTYDTIRYYQYVASLKSNERPMDVEVIDTYRHTHGRRSGWYTYEATFRFNGQERVVAIEEEDYERLNAKNARLAVLYNATVNDFTAVNYSPSLLQLLVPGFFWLMLVLVFRQNRKPDVQPDKT